MGQVIGFLNRRTRELTTVSMRIAKFVADTQSAGTSAGNFIGYLVLALLGALALIAAMAGARKVLQHRGAPAPFTREEPPGFEPERSGQAQPHVCEAMFPLTGHMPSDVRRALYGAQQ